MNLFSIAMVLLCVTYVYCEIDWSNLDVVNYKYFKYPTRPPAKFFINNGHLYSIRKIPDPPNKIQDTVSRAKAVFTYFKGLFFGTVKEKTKIPQVFDPEKGEKNSKIFQSKHGKHGEKLIEFIGQGPSHEKLVKAGVI